MARLFEDGFDHYGNDEAKFLDGVYLNAGNQAGAGVTLSTAQFVTGTHSAYFTRSQNTDHHASIGGLRKVMPTAQTKMGTAGRYYIPQAPTDSTSVTIANFLSANPDFAQVTVVVDANGRFCIYRGAAYDGAHPTFSNLIAQSDPLIGMASWNHIEVQVFIHDTLGWVRIAVNGVHRFQAENLDTKYDTSNIVSVAVHSSGESGASIVNDFYMDDWYIYDFTGDSAVDTDFCPATDGSGFPTNYIGELQVMWQPPDGDTAEDDWIPLSGTDSFEMVNETSVDDADYVYSTAAGDLTEWDLLDLPEEISYIRGLTVWGRLSKSDSGAVMIRFGMKSDASVEDAPERPVTTIPTYWWDQINVDPDSGARWTRASFNAAWGRLTRNV